VPLRRWKQQSQSQTSITRPEDLLEMNFEIGLLFALLGGMVYLFLTEKLPVDLTAFLGLLVLIFGGYLSPAEAFTGFSSPAVITMLSVFIVGAALLETGMADVIGGRIHRVVGDSETRLVVVLMIVCGVLSAFMNNIAAVAVLMPAVAAIARRSGIPPSRLFMPLAFGAILGGTTTMVGTPPNIVAAQVMAERGMEPFSLFDFTPIGLALLAVGSLFMVTIGRRLLPSREDRGPAAGDGKDLTQVYQLTERLFSIRVPEDSQLDGLTLSETRLGNTLGIKVLSIQREGKERLALQGASVLRSGDVLFVEGDAADLEELLRLQSLEVEKAELDQLPTPIAGFTAVVARVAEGSGVAGSSLRDLRLRERLGLVIIGIRHEGLLHRVNLAAMELRAGDEILGVATEEAAEQLARNSDFENVSAGLDSLSELSDELFLVRVPGGSSLAGSTMGESRLGDLVGLTVAGRIRNSEMRLALDPDEVLQAGDELLITAEPSGILQLAEVGEVEVLREVTASLESQKVGMVEVAVAPRSNAVGRTLKELDFRDRYGLLALAIWRRGEPMHVDFSEVPLQLGDALLFHGQRAKMKLLSADRDFVVLSDSDQAPRNTRKAPYALASLFVLIGLVASGYQPIHVAAFTAGSLVLLARALTMEQAYRAIEWRAIFLVAAVLPVGLAMERTGAALLLAEGVTRVAGDAGNHAILAALVVLASVLSQGLDGAPAVVLLAPVVIGTAEGLGISARPLMMGVSLAASAAFMTPFSHKANLLVMGAGGYRARDYLKVGTPLTVVILAMLVLLIPLFFPF
jgi:di/tricarboxylate transporter